MIYIFSGDDTKNKLKDYEKFIKSVPVSTEKFLINRREFDPAQVRVFILVIVFSLKNA